MANEIETLDVTRQKPPRPQVSPTAGVPEGALAGAGFGAVFGGPIGALIGLGVGVLSRRARQSILDTAAKEQDTAYALNNEIADQIQRGAVLLQSGLGTRVDAEQLQTFESQRRKLSIASTDPDPNVRAQARAGLVNLSTAPWLEDIEKRADALEDATRQARASYGKEQVSAFNKYRDTTDKATAEGSAILKLSSELGSDNPSVQARYKNFVGGSFAGEEVGLHIKGLGLEPGDRIASGDEIVKAVTAVTSAVTDYTQKRSANIAQDLQKRGYAINTSEDGSLFLDTEEVPLAKVPAEQQKPGREPSFGGTVERGIVDPIISAGERLNDAAMKNLEGGVELAPGVTPEEIQRAEQFHQQQKAKRRRPVNP